MVSMKTVLCRDYTWEIFIQPKISACGGWAVAERDEHASLHREMWPQQLLPWPWWRSEKKKKKQAGPQVDQATKYNVTQLQF